MNHRRSWAALAVLLAVGTADCKTRTRNLIIFCAGDSITERGYPRFLRRALGEDGVKAKVLNYGRSGFTTAEYLEFLQSGAETLKAERPDIVLVALGTNDVRVDSDRVSRKDFDRNLREIVGIFRMFRSRAGDRPTILLAAIPPLPERVSYPFGPESIRRVTSEINPSIRALCQDLDIIFVDNYSLFQISPQLLPGVHPSPEGYKAMAGNWLKALRPLLKEWE